MIKIRVVYPNKLDGRFDLDYYLAEHMPLVARLYGDFGLISWEVEKGTSMSAKIAADYLLACNLCFDSMQNAKLALKNEGGKVMKDVENFTDIVPVISFGEVIGASST